MVMACWQATIVDENGDVQASPSITVRRESDAALATIYSDRAGTVAIGNPFTGGTDGLARFFAAGDAYMITATKGGFSQTWRYVGIGLASESDGLSVGIGYRFSELTADADPGSSYLRLNNATLASVSQMFIDDQSIDLDISSYIDTWDDFGSSNNRGVLILQQNDGGAYFVATVTGTITDPGTYKKVSLTHIASGGDFVQDKKLSVIFVARGADALREVLTANRTYYVRTDGSDSNTGLVDSAGGAFLTVQKAADVVFTTLDLASFSVDVQIRDGTYGGINISRPQVGEGGITFKGNAATPANVILTTTSLGADSGTVNFRNGAIASLQDFEIRSVTSGNGIYCRSGGVVSINNIRFGACAGVQILSTQGGYVSAIGNYLITGGGTIHCQGNAGGEYRCQSKTITISGTPAFSVAFAVADYAGILTINGNTWSGSATGKRFLASVNGVIAALAGLTELPGNASGTTDSGGIHPSINDPVLFVVACSDETTAITATANKVKFRMPYAFQLTEIPRAGLSTAQGSGTIFTVDVNKSGSTILSTKLTVDNTETTSTTAATAAVLSSSSFTADEEISIDVDTIGDGTAKGLKVTLIGYRI